MVWKTLAAVVAAVVLVIAINFVGNLVFNAGAPPETPQVVEDRRGEPVSEVPAVTTADTGEAEGEPAQEVVTPAEPQPTPETQMGLENGAGDQPVATQTPAMPTEESEQFQAEVQEEAQADAAPADDAAAAGDLAGDPEAGQSAARVCAACHTFDQGGANRTGPNLWGVFGDDVASKEGFNYSQALQGEEGSWTVEKLDAYLANPRQAIPGNRMAFAGVRDEEQRRNIIAYMQTLE